MELIIKPTGRCNFNCKFCSAYDLKTNEDPKHVHPKILELISKLSPNRLLVNGGDPLMMDPDWFYEIHEYSKIDISITTNLKDFYLNPTKWASLFNEQWMYVCTSFQYGNGRMWDINTVYTEDMFLKVRDKFFQYVYHGNLPFIAVIDWDNEQFWMDHVLLAKRVGTQVRMNNCIPVGRSDKWYPRYKMFQFYIDIIKQGLGMYETNCDKRSHPSCPRNNFYQCNKHIRTCYVDMSGNLHVGNCDELIVQGLEYHSDGEIIGNDIPNQIDPTEFIREECTYCSLCRLCNGCNVNRMFAKQDPKYCDEMKKLEKDICDQNWIL